MRSCETHTISEYGGFTRGAARPGYERLSEKTFTALETLILENNAGSDTEAVELLSLSAHRGGEKVITARNYVGVITMNDGTAIEILPKIAGHHIARGEEKQIEQVRRIFLEMLKSLKDVTFKDFNISHLRVERLDLLEIFMKMFLDEVRILAKQGLKASYTPVESNEPFYKGKLLAAQNIKHNLVNRQRFFVCYDEFTTNRPENRLIKSTLAFVLRTTGDDGNRQQAAQLLSFFDGVDYSTSIDSDFSQSLIDRSMNHYDKALSWCKVFLSGKSFTAFAGSEIALALLFPMQEVFESYIAAKLRRHIGNGVKLETQKVRHSLFDTPKRAFSLKPDIVLGFGGRTIVLDTKWKLLSDNAWNSGISQSDMYQMYAYGKKYAAERVVLLYPRSDTVSRTDISYTSNDGVTVDVAFVDLTDTDTSISTLLDQIGCPRR